MNIGLPPSETLPKPFKPIRSFVRREGRMTPGQEKAWQLHYEKYGLDTADGLLDISQVFKRKAPCFVEIGFGMGHSLLAAAKANPEKDYIGIETYRPGIGTLLAGAAQDNLTNLKIYHADAVEVLQQCIAEGSLAGLQIFFPDPWPKKRHHKRRLIQRDFVHCISTRLGVGGCLHLATDWQPYALHMMEVLTQFPSFQNEAGEGQYATRSEERPVVTKFEARGYRLGHQVWELRFIRV